MVTQTILNKPPYLHNPAALATDCLTTTKFQVGPWLRRSWQSGRFRHQRSAVQIQTLAINIFKPISVNCFQAKMKIRKKVAGNGPLKKLNFKAVPKVIFVLLS